MRILNVFGFFTIFCINYSDQQFNVRMQCKSIENSPLLRLSNHLFCDYDKTIHPNYPKTTNVSLRFMPKLINLETDQAKLSLHSWIALSWTDPQLTWTPSNYDGINITRVKSSRIWTPSLSISNSGEMSNDQFDLSKVNCLLYNSGFVFCVPMLKFIAKCNPDYTYWPYDKHRCRITFESWVHTDEEVDLLMMDKTQISLMNEYTNDTIWDFKFINWTKEVTKNKCCSDDTFSTINFDFLLTRYHSNYYTIVIVPAIALILLTLIVLCLNLNSVERIAMASVNFICHLLCMYVMHWIVPYNGANPPNILIFYRESLALATFAIILTAVLRKLEAMSTQIPNWISFTTTIVLSNKAGRFLILKDDEFKMAGKDIATEESSDVSKSEMNTKKLFWKYFAAIIDWLSFFCVILTYAIILIILVPAV
ncbi:PREDICTED: neuronal acetylcholine receptor subunit alpha-5-like isoform X2 [Wasmannia auropunctata]|uniref:neuronal acetylcholine receptor subunit alpha-5-like isoform X2 n=1 Tax=Wasmannia auropunctata TaxID=64793 RepID=UPI0005EEE10D|nr:PREDICTED: neuronal acetylcholine receptor subunit alpha-5-like isoform X2 [Wasmannia auropunctata]